MNTLTATFENDVSDLFIGNTNNSTDAYLDEASFLNNNSQNSDTESISEDSRKIRKKRNTYQKISDEIRIELLEAVNKGETLKSAARRYNINYSSAKSILHTYRREGRITKKSAQERTIKKKNTSSEEVSSPAKNVKGSKKKNPKSLIDCDFLQDTLPYNERTVSMTTCASLTEDNSPVSSGVHYNENFSSLLKPEYKETSQESRKLSIEHPIDNFFASQTDSYYPEVGADYYGETYNQSANVYNNDGIDSFQQLMNAFQRKPSLNTDDFFNDSNTFLYPKGVTPVNSQENKVFNFDNNDNTPFNSYLETQDLLKQALRKASMGYNGGYRKNSFDMF